MTDRSSNPLVVGLLGGIGAGKSEVARCFSQQGATIVAADPIGHEVLREPSIRDRVAARWGSALLDTTGEIDRRALANIVFADASARRELETIVMPSIHDRMADAVKAARLNSTTRLIVVDAAIMMETGWNKACDQLVYIHTPRPMRLARLARRGWSEADTLQREAAQWPLARKAAAAHVALDNSTTTDALRSQIDRLMTQWRVV